MPDQEPPPAPEPARAKKPRARAAKAVVTINPLFKALIWVNAVLCIVTFAGMVAMAFFAPKEMTKAQEQLATACETVFKMTAGAFIGLLGGRAGAPDKIRPPSGGP